MRADRHIVTFAFATFAALFAVAPMAACSKPDSEPTAAPAPGPSSTSSTASPGASAAPAEKAAPSAAPAAADSAHALAPSTSAPAVATTAAAPSGAPAAAAGSAKAGGAGVGECGTKPLPDCPLQAWMKANANPPVMASDLPALATALDKIAGFAPSGYTNWSSIAKDGAAAAKSGDLTAAKAACRSCHDQYKAKYKSEIRGRKI